MRYTSAGFKLILALSKAWFSIVLHHAKKDKLIYCAYLAITSIGTCRPICSQLIVTLYGSWCTSTVCMHHAEIDTYCMDTYIHTNENTHTNIQTEISEINFSNPCTNKHGYHNMEEIQCGSSKQDSTAKGSKGWRRNLESYWSIPYQIGSVTCQFLL